MNEEKREGKSNLSRRAFVKGAAAIGAGISLAGILSGTKPGAAAAPPAKGKSTLQLSVPKMDKVRIGIIGLGARGSGAVGRLSQIEGVEITALCDVRPSCVEGAQKTLARMNKPKALEFSKDENDWKNLASSKEVDFVYTCTPWHMHTPICVFAMEQGKHAATEVPAAISLDECWQLVDTAEKTQRHCMMLENCCYGENELLALNLCRLGILGELVHGEAAYLHDLRGYKFASEREGGYQGLWRLKHSMVHTGNPYPTHGLGPVSQYMGINRGDRFDYMASLSSAQLGLTAFAIGKFGADSPEARQTYKLGDMNTTVIRTVKGRTIMVQHNTTSPRPYSRLNLISGTKGILADYPLRVAIDSDSWMSDKDLEAFRVKYRHPMWKQVGEVAMKVGGHGGMDFVMDWRLIYCLRNGEPLDQSVYDAAAWSSIGPLSEVSVTNRGKSVDVPDFTRGMWEKVPPLPVIGA